MPNIENAYFAAGWQAYVEGLPIQANPMLYKANPWRLWDMGHMTAHFIDMARDNQHSLPEDGPPSQLQRLDKSPFVQGQCAFISGIALSDCPYGNTSQDAFDWRCGHLFEEAKNKPKVQHTAPIERLGWLAALVVFLRRLWP